MADGRPDELDKAYFSARNASEADAAAWQARLEADPHDLVARASWIGWHMNRDLHGFLQGSEFGKQVLWLVENHPGSTLTGLVAPLGSSNRRGIDQAVLQRAWQAALEQHPQDVRVLQNAASYFGLQDRDKALELLQAIRARCPEDPGAEWALASHWLLRARRLRTRIDAVPYVFGNEFDAAAGRRALEHAERAIELNGAESSNEYYEVTRIEAAAAAGAWERAEEVARAALARGAESPPNGITGKLAYHSNRILGHAALRRADLSSARKHLLDCCSAGSSPQLSSFGPDWSLARELLEHGEREVVLEFLKRCRSIWRGHDDELELWELQIQRGEPCAFARAGSYTSRSAARPSAKVPAANGKEEPDDRSPTERAYVAGLRGDEEQAREWLARIQQDPEDMCARASWLGWAGRHQDEAEVLEEVRRQLEWIVLNRPEHSFAGHAASKFTNFGRPSLRGYVDELWKRHIQQPDVRPEVLANAASHFWIHDDALTLELLERAARLDPDNPKWPAQSAFVRLRAAGRRSDSRRFADRFDASRCEDAWIDAERAHRLSRGGSPDHLLFETLMKAAAGAGRWERSTEIAREALQCMPSAAILRVRKVRCLEIAHLILGLAAAQRGDRDAIRSEMRAALACLSPEDCGFYPPYATLALELHALGDREAMPEFLASSRTLRPNDQAQIDLWERQVREGRTPKLEFLWTHF